MKLSEVIYKNTYFNFYINFSYGWIFRKRSKSINSNMHYQINDSDLPDDDGDHKTLIFATYRQNKSIMSRCNFSISVHKRSGYFDLLKFAKEKSDVIDCKYENIEFLENKAQMVTIEQHYCEKMILTKVVVWSESPGLWISAVAEGDSLESFNMADRLFSEIRRLNV